MKIYDKAGGLRCEVSGASGQQEKTLQGDNVLTMAWTAYEYVELDVDDYADFGGERYWLLERVKPRQKSTVAWQYDVKMYGVESLTKRFLVINNEFGDSNPSFTFTAPAMEHARLLVESLNEAMGVKLWKVGEVKTTENLVINYDGVYVSDALALLAEKAKTEYWFEQGTILNVSRAEWGEELEIGYGKGLTYLEPDKADNVKFYTRLYPVGSSRNIDSAVYGHKTLQLPGGRRYVDKDVDKYGVIHHYEREAFGGIYPRRVGTVSSVRSEERKGQDGKPFTVYYFKDSGLTFNPNDYEIAGAVKRVSWQEGSALAGIGTGDDYYFEVNWDEARKEFEVVTQFPEGGEQLPGGMLVPKEGDRYILWNLKMPTEYYAMAEQELLEAVEAYNQENSVDNAVYRGETDHVWVEDNEVELYVGRRVKLLSKEFFAPQGYRRSRITKLVRKVDLPSLVTVEISDAVAKSKIEALEGGLADVRNYVRQSVGTAIEVVGSGDATRPGEHNVYSAARAVKEFVSRLWDDVVKGVLTFEKGIITKAVSYFKGIVNDGSITNYGNITNYGDLTNTGSMQTRNLAVTGTATFFELEIIKAKASGGLDIKGPGEFHADLVEEVLTADGRLTGYRLYQNAEKDGRTLMQTVEAGDQMLSCRFNVGAGRYSDTGNHYYWRLVMEAPTEYVDKSIAGKMCRCLTITLSATDRDPSSNDAPQVGDDLVTCGSRTNSSRMGVQVTSVYRSFDGGLKTPYWAQYWGLNNYDWASHRRTFFATGDNSIVGNLRVTSPTGDTVRVPADKGAWTPSAAYGYYDRVSHEGALWLCTAPPGTLTHEEPGKGDAWQKQVEKGDMPVEMTISTDSGGTVIRNGQGRVTLRARLYRNGAEITSEYPETAFWWTRDSGLQDYDAAWNARHERAGNIITVDAEDIFKKAVFHCEVRI